jgi:hypothetical protein
MRRPYTIGVGVVGAGHAPPAPLAEDSRDEANAPVLVQVALVILLGAGEG